MEMSGFWGYGMFGGVVVMVWWVWGGLVEFGEEGCVGGWGCFGMGEVRVRGWGGGDYGDKIGNGVL